MRSPSFAHAKTHHVIVDAVSVTKSLKTASQPDDYARFGFAEAGVHGFEAPCPIAAKNAGAWMVLTLGPGILRAVPGTVRCATAMDEPRYWRE